MSTLKLCSLCLLKVISFYFLRIVFFTGFTAQPQIESDAEIAVDLRPLAVQYTDGRVHRFRGTATVPPSDDDAAARSKDVCVETTGLSHRLYLPNPKSPETQKTKLPLLIYFHGGGFFLGSPQSPDHNQYLNRVAAEVPAVVVSVAYRLAPEHPIPAAYDDSWAAVLWAISLSDPWLKDYADTSRMFFAGDSAGANIAHHMAIRLGAAAPELRAAADLAGLILVHPGFAGESPVGGEKQGQLEFLERWWRWICPATSGLNDPWVNPEMDGRLAALGTGRLVVFVAEEDTFFRDRGVGYVEVLKKSGWAGAVELVEHKGERHVFHLVNPPNQNSEEMMKKLVDFINNEEDGTKIQSS